MAERIGTCGWQYDDWRDAFYPHELAKTSWLPYYSGVFDTVECDNAFYRLPTRETFQKWAGVVPDGFSMAVKASRFLTHVKRLNDPQEPVQRLLDAAGGLGDRLGPILVQLPPTMRVDVDRLAQTLHCFPSTVRVAVEPRHDSWWTDALRRLLEDRRAALAWSDRLGSPVAPMWRTADWGYLRLHEGRPAYPPDYGKPVLRKWLRRLHEAWGDQADLFIYFNNDPGAAAIRNASTIRDLSRAAHSPHSR